MAVDPTAAGSLLKVVRDQLTCPTAARVHVAGEVAGWLDPGDGEPVDAHGRRPLPLVLAELAGVWQRAAITPADREVAAAYYGVDAFPVDLAGRDAGSVASRLAEREGTPPAASTLDLRRRRAVTAIAAVMQPRPGTPRAPITTPVDPSQDRWWAGPTVSPGAVAVARSHHPPTAELMVRRAAFDIADDLATVGGERELRLRGALQTLRREVDRALTGRWQPPPSGSRTPSTVERRRARALSGVALWWLMSSAERTADVLAGTLPGPGTSGPARSAPSQPVPLVAGSVPSPRRLRSARPLLRARSSPAAAPGGAGEHAPTTAAGLAGADLEAQIDAAWKSLHDNDGHTVDVHGCAAALAAQGRALPAETRVRLGHKMLALRAREAVQRGDWHAVVAARQLSETAGPSYLTLQATVDGVIAATAHRRYDTAERLLSDGLALVDVWRRPSAFPCPWDSTRERRLDVERVEFTQQLWQLAASVRRRRVLTLLAEAHPTRDARAAEEVPEALAGARRATAYAAWLLTQLPHGWDGRGDPRERHGGDADVTWPAVSHAVAGELDACEAVWVRAYRRPGATPLHDPLDRAYEQLARARDIPAPGPRLAGFVDQLDRGLHYLAAPAAGGRLPIDCDGEPCREGHASGGDHGAQLASGLRAWLDADLPTPDTSGG